jgi:cation transporter-like permease
MTGTIRERGDYRSRLRHALIVGVGTFVLSLVGIGAYAYFGLDSLDLSINGYIALTLGIVGTAALGSALMALVFFSDRSGIDDDASAASKRRR